MTFFGTGFTDTQLQSIVFKVGEIKEQIKLNYDPKTSTFFCKCVNFDSGKNKFNEPTECTIQIALDGKNYFPYEKKLLIYRK